jgi:hypothetical protein
MCSTTGESEGESDASIKLQNKVLTGTVTTHHLPSDPKSEKERFWCVCSADIKPKKP